MEPEENDDDDMDVDDDDDSQVFGIISVINITGRKVTCIDIMLSD